ncbi:MAG: bifunctional 4-hydroxy-3-methylbut-2-enyl diphosphate reductase/30S ribosomal protein S1 [Peptococcaceae bacterium]|nr:bifunctional 4-hydroxy-3-methylbut-2-enyl diphosphate reductase/30S ribosomal protein S1 [Peptococcaceae bacterium]
MKVIMAAKAGFCFGVRRAIDLAKKTAKEETGAVSLGPLIHNRLVVERLEEQGIQAIGDIGEVQPGQCLIIRSHGVSPRVYEEAAGRGIQIIDATCPFVQKAQHLAAEAAKYGPVIVVGDKRHPEVQGILGWAGPEAKAIATVEEARALPAYDGLSILAQTTLQRSHFEEIVEEVRGHAAELTVHNTICYMTGLIQEAAISLADRVDVMVVIGGRNSANTRKLESICQRRVPTHLVETKDELEEAWFQSVKIAGLTAGASTPDWIIEEVFKAMSEMNVQDIQDTVKEPDQPDQLNQADQADQADQPHQADQTDQPDQAEDDDASEAGVINMDNWEEGFQVLHRGSIVDGIVVKINDNDVLLDIGWKSEGIVALRDLAVGRVERPEEIISLGDKVRAMIVRMENEEGYPILSVRRAREIEAVGQLQEIYEDKSEIQAQVAEIVKGGLLVDVGMRGFVPASQVQVGYVNDLNQFLGETLRLRIIEFDLGKKRVVLSQKVILQEEQAVKREQLLSALSEGDIVDGVVCRLVSFGAFVDIGGMDGLLHISDMAYSRIKHPSEIVEIGDEIRVQVLKIDREAGKISLGFKQLKENPWDQVAAKYPVGEIVSGKIVRLAYFGAFVQLEDGIDALIHISQLANRRIEKPEEVVQVGETVRAKVLECEPEKKRISLTVRELLREEQAALDADAVAAQETILEVTIGEVLHQDQERKADETAPEKSDEVISDEVISDEVVSDEVASDEVASDEVASDEVASDEVASDEVASDEVVSDEVASDEDTKSEEDISHHEDV